MGSICKTIENVITSRRSGTSGTYRPAQWLIDYFTGGSESASGVRVNEQSALKYTPFWAATRIISGTVGSLPFKTYETRDDGGKNPIKTHPVYKLLHDRPNDYMDALTFLETRQAHVLTHGNGYAEIQRDGGGRPIALWPLLPNTVSRKIYKNLVPYYEVRLPNGELAFLPDYDVLHIKGLGFDGYTGYNVVQYHKDAIGYGIAVKDYGARFFANDASPGGVLEHPAAMSQAAYDRLKASWLEKHQGLKQSHRLQILEEGMKFAKTVIDPAQAQALEIQKYTVDDCSRIFNMPPHMLGSMEFSKYNNVEQLELEFIKRTMLYWFRKWESECNYKLFMPSEYGKYFCEILYEGLLRGDIKTRFECYNIGRNIGVYSINDIRIKENMNPIGPAGDIYLEPLNMVPAGTPRDNNSNNNDGLLRSFEIRSEHKSLMITHWLRIIKQFNGNPQSNKDIAIRILREPVRAFASILRKQDSAEGILKNLLDEIIRTDTKFTECDANKLADLTMSKITGERI
jgi:HK97 family phage portal protein